VAEGSIVTELRPAAQNHAWESHSVSKIVSVVDVIRASPSASNEPSAWLTSHEKDAGQSGTVKDAQ
jgi:hypothetical protein